VGAPTLAVDFFTLARPEEGKKRLHIEVLKSSFSEQYTCQNELYFHGP
jgi:hypothetical protein